MKFSSDAVDPLTCKDGQCLVRHKENDYDGNHAVFEPVPEEEGDPVET